MLHSVCGSCTRDLASGGGTGLKCPKPPYSLPAARIGGDIPCSRATKTFSKRRRIGPSGVMRDPNEEDWAVTLFI